MARSGERRRIQESEATERMKPSDGRREREEKMERKRQVPAEKREKRTMIRGWSNGERQRERWQNLTERTE